MGPAGLPRIQLEPGIKFVVVGGGKSACDAILYLRRRLQIGRGQTANNISWVSSTSLAYLRREIHGSELERQYFAELHRDCEASPSTQLHDLRSYPHLFHHFTVTPPDTSHLGILSEAEVEELRSQARYEGQRVVCIENERIVLTHGEFIPCDQRTVIVTCTGPSRNDATRACLQRISSAMAKHVPDHPTDIDQLTFFTLLCQGQVSRSNYFLSEIYFSYLDPKEGLAAIKRSVRCASCHDNTPSHCLVSHKTHLKSSCTPRSPLRLRHQGIPFPFATSARNKSPIL